MARIAVLIDAENAQQKFAEIIIAHARTLGDTNIVRLFGDFSQSRQSAWWDFAHRNGHELIQQANGGSGKNSTDIVLAIHAMDILFSDAADAFCLVSDDRDFLPLATRLRGAGKRVHVICRHPDHRMQNVCSTVFALAALVNAEPPIVRAFLAVTASREGEITLGEIGKLLRQHAPDLIPATGKGAVRKLLKASGRFDEIGEGPQLRIRLKP